MKLSSIFTINWQDALKGFITAMITSVISSVSTIIYTQRLPTVDEWKLLGLIGLGAGLSYLTKNFFTPAPTQVQIDPTKTEVVDMKTKEVISEKQYLESEETKP